MNVLVFSEAKLRQVQARSLGVIDGNFPFHRNGTLSIGMAELAGEKALCLLAKKMGGDVIVFEPYVEMPAKAGSDEVTLMLSACVYILAEW